MNAIRLAAAAGLSALALAAAPAMAQQADGPPASSANDELASRMNGDSLTIGGGAVYLPDYEGSNDYRVVPAPAALGSYKGFSFLLAGNRLNIDLIPNRPGPVIDIQAGPIVVVNFNRTSNKNIDDRRVRALGELDTAFEIGGYVGIGKTGVITSPYDKLSVSVSYRHDVSNVSDSHIWQPSINYLTPLSRKAAVTFFASAENAGRGYAQTYFGVTPAQSVASSFPVYYARGGWKNWSLGGVAAYSITGDLLHGFKVVAGLNYRRMLGDFGDSPIVSQAGSRSQWMAGGGLAYTF